MANIYKLLDIKNEKLSKVIFTKNGAKKYQEKMKNKGIQTEIVLYKENVTIFDNNSEYTGIVEFFRNDTVAAKK